MRVKLRAGCERWRLRKPFTISSGSYTHIDTVLVELSDGPHRGRGEAAGVDYHGDTTEPMLADIESVRAEVAAGLDRPSLQDLLPAGGARNALDCALWDLEAKRAGRRVWELLGIQARPVTTVYTVGLDQPAAMAADAAAHRDFPALKLKLGRDDPLAQVAAVHGAAPAAEIVADVNQGWRMEDLREYAPRLAALGVRMIEQPLPTGDDYLLEGYDCPVALCCDESCQTLADLPRIAGRYDLVNIKLDKTGGLTEALRLSERGRALGLGLMVGNMLGSSLAMAPAFVIAQFCRYVDIDGPLLQVEDRPWPMHYSAGRVAPPDARLWG